MGTQLPRWVWVGAVLLACVGGMVNVIGYLGFEHQAVSHLTGTTSLLGAALAHGDWKAVAHLWGVLIAFCAGAMISGMFTDLGIGLGHMLRGMPLPVRRLTLSGFIISGFLAGGIIGAWLFSRLQYNALLAPAILTGAIGIGYVLYRQWTGVRRDPST